MSTRGRVLPPLVSERHTNGGAGSGGDWYIATKVLPPVVSERHTTGGTCTLPAGIAATCCAADFALAAALFRTIASGGDGRKCSEDLGAIPCPSRAIDLDSRKIAACAHKAISQ